MNLLSGTLEQGLIYAVMALGVYITYKILDFPDLTVDGSFPLGGTITAAMLAAGVSPLLALPASFLAGVLAGTCTGLIHVKLKVRNLIAGIIVMTALYTVNLRIAGKANVPLFTAKTIFQNPFLQKHVPTALAPYVPLVIIVVIALAAKFLLDWYLSTKSGYLLRAVGDNESLVTTLAKDKGTVKIVGLAISNGLVALAGSVMVQWQRVYDISMGPGTVVIGLASVIIGLSLVKRISFVKVTTAVLAGAIAYRACIAIAIALGLEATDLKLITAVLLLVILVVSRDRVKKVKSRART